VYVRKGGSKRPANQVDINRKSRRLAEQISSEFVARVEQVAAIPLGSDLVAVDPDRPGFGVKLVEAGQGIPVSLQEESEVALPISELINADTPYSKPANEVGAQVRMWHTDSNHRVGRRTLFRWFQRRNQVEWTSQFSEFCILSACSDHAYPLFWASKLSRNRLARLIREMMRRDTHPEVAVVPYLIAGFYWSDRNRFLDELETSTEYKSVMASIRKIRGIGSQNEFLTGVRSGGSSIAVADERVNKNELLGDPSRAADMLETVVQRRLEEKATDQEKSSGHQLDILAHCQ
jgi:hypothetical protein